MFAMTTRCTTAVLCTAALLLLGAFAAAPQADASAIYTCVKKNGAPRFVTKKAKCKKGETKLSWNTQGPAGKNGLNALNGVNGAAGKDGLQGKEGPAGSAVAYARVEANGTLDTAHSKNITKVELNPVVGTGDYCITPSVPVHNAVVSAPHVPGVFGVFVEAGIPANGDAETSGCPGSPWVAIWDNKGEKLTNHPFYIIFN